MHPDGGLGASLGEWPITAGGSGGPAGPERGSPEESALGAGLKVGVRLSCGLRVGLELILPFLLGKDGLVLNLRLLGLPHLALGEPD